METTHTAMKGQDSWGVVRMTKTEGKSTMKVVAWGMTEFRAHQAAEWADQ